MKSDEVLDKIRNKLKESDPSNRTLTSIFLFNFINENGELIKNVVMDFNELKIYDGSINNADVEITITDEDFFAVGSKTTGFEDLVKNNKVQIKGNQEALARMMEKFRMNSLK